MRAIEISKKLGAFEKMSIIASDAGFELTAGVVNGSEYQLKSTKSRQLINTFHTLADVLEYLEVSEAQSL